MSTKTLRGLAAGAGALAVIAASATSAAATDITVEPFTPESNSADYWEGVFTDEGFSNVSCVKVDYSGPEQKAVTVPTNVPEGYDWLAVIIKSGTENTVVFEPVAGETYSPVNGKGISHVISCIAQLEGDDTTETEEPGDDDTVTEQPGTDEPTETDEPGTDEPTETGPAVETDGPSSKGMNGMLIGGTALLLGGAGAAAVAMRRNPEAR